MPPSARDGRSAWIGLDLGTSGCRAVAVDANGATLAVSKVPLPEPVRPSPGRSEQAPALWWDATLAALDALNNGLDGHRPSAICVDATSATLLLCGENGDSRGPALMYDDRRSTEAADRIAQLAPPDSPAQGPSSSLAKLIHLHRGLAPRSPVKALHQADWILGRLTGRFGVSDWNNALKLGYEATTCTWPSWVRALVPEQVELPQVLRPGDLVATLAPEVATRLTWPHDTCVLAGTTDSTAAAIATGIRDTGDAVTSLGSTLVVKILSPDPLQHAGYGVYSQRFGEQWLVGGASNSGGQVLRRYFNTEEMSTLSESIDPSRPSGLSYYPLLAPGERFPRNDPDLPPVVAPRPADPSTFLHGLLEGIARIEREGYARLAELGAPRPRQILTIGGGAANPTWTRLRERIIGIPVRVAAHQDAAYGAACLARDRTRTA